MATQGYIHGQRRGNLGHGDSLQIEFRLCGSRDLQASRAVLDEDGCVLDDVTDGGVRKARAHLPDEAVLLAPSEVRLGEDLWPGGADDEGQLPEAAVLDARGEGRLVVWLLQLLLPLLPLLLVALRRPPAPASSSS